MDLLLFIFATAGLTWILVLSSSFRPFREYITRKNKSKKNVINSFLDGILNCEGCFGVWAGGVVYILQYYKIEIVLYCFAGSFCSLFLISLLKAVSRK